MGRAWVLESRDVWEKKDGGKVAMTAELVKMNSETFREAKAKRIRELMLNWAKNTVELGKELKAAQSTFEVGPRGKLMGWKTWLRDEFNFSADHARALIQVATKFADRADQMRELGVAILICLSRASTPEAAKAEIISRARKGEHISARKAKRIIKKHRPTPKEAMKIARETGRPTAATDGYIYLGGTPEQIKKADERRTLVFGVRRAIETLAIVELTPTEFLATALPHQLWREKEEHQIHDAMKWLDALHAAWSVRK
jgi:hypothetical protein